MTLTWMKPFLKNSWTGQAELWTDPSGHQAESSTCSLQFRTDRIDYRWAYQGELQRGSFLFRDEQFQWTDTWHQAKPVSCQLIPDRRGLITLEYDYPAPPGPDWGWRIMLSQRPDGTLVLQMANIAPWGEENRAVRMIFQADFSDMI